MPQYVSGTIFNGLAKSNQLIVPIANASMAPMIRCENFRGMVDLASEGYNTPPVGIITKAPQIANYKTTMAASGRTRGVFQYFPTGGNPTGSYLMNFQCTTDYTASVMRALDIDANGWKTLLTGADAGSPYHMCYEQYGDKVYMCNGDSTFIMRKWQHVNTAWESKLPTLYDKGGTAVNLAGFTLTWAPGGDTDLVTSNADISGTLSEGMWIRKSSASLYWDEIKNVTNGGLNINLMVASSDSGAGGAGTSQAAPALAIGYPRFIKVWKDKMWAACDVISTGTASRLWWSVTGNVEDWTSSGAGYLDVGNVQGEQITGMGAFDDYLVIFKDFSYYLYRWTGDLDEPIELIKTCSYGCASERTIHNIDNAVVYFTGDDLRITNGNSDISVAGDMLNYLKTNGSSRSSVYFSLSATDNSYWWAYVDTFRSAYVLCKPQTSGNTIGIVFDYNTWKCLGIDYYYDAGHGCPVYSTSSYPAMVFSKMASSNQLITFLTYGGDYATAGYLESAILHSGYPNKKIKIYWMEFDFHPILGNGSIDTTVSFNYRKDFEAIDSTKAQTYDLDYTVATNLDRAYISDTHRFPVNDTFQYFSWYLTETFGGSAADDIGIISWTICYDLLETT